MPHNQRRQKRLIVAPNTLQKRLTASFILPNINELFSAITELRISIDQIIGASTQPPLSATVAYFLSDEALQKLIQREITPASKYATDQYPIGWCCQITHIVVSYLVSLDDKVRDKLFPGLGDFIRQGGVLKRIWGMVRQQYFQNAIQIGTIYLDVSNDTVDIRKPKTEWALLEACDFANINSFHQYAKILQSYHNKTLFLNYCFPHLAPLCPIWTRQENGPLCIDYSSFMADLAHDTNYHASEALFETPSSNFKTLTTENLNHIKSSTQKLKGKAGLVKFLQFEIVNENERRRIFNEYRNMTISARNEYIGRLQNYIKIINYQLFLAHQKNANLTNSSAAKIL